MAMSAGALLDKVVAPSLSNRVRVLTLLCNKQNPFRFSSSVSASDLPFRIIGISLSFLENSQACKTCSEVGRDWGCEKGNASFF